MSEASSPKAEPLEFKENAPKWQKKDVSNSMAKARGKRNLMVTDSTEHFDSMFSKSVTNKDNHRDNIAGLKREFHFLNKLRESGITPTPLQLMADSKNMEAHLAMKSIPGVSLESAQSSPEIRKDRFGDVITSVDNAISTIHKYGVLLVDVNKGSFVVEGLTDEKEVKTRVVDFELAESAQDVQDPEVAKKIQDFARGEDLGLAMETLDPNFRLSLDAAKKVDHYLAMKSVLECYLGSAKSLQVDTSRLSPEERSAYETQLQVIDPKLRQLFDQSMREWHNRMAFLGAMDEDENTFVANKFEKDYSRVVAEAMMNVTLPYLLADKQIALETQVMHKLQQQLNPILSERPLADVE